MIVNKKFRQLLELLLTTATLRVIPSDLMMVKVKDHMIIFTDWMTENSHLYNMIVLSDLCDCAELHTPHKVNGYSETQG